ncbi:hypothetical protein [Idiomarina sp.]|uniref:hypothetical protein n=1 Tax=Idiomarina sp. TaxID=1874361 RepID=UPI0025864A90|nr:hypothetical protein [Idiomarina sp.]
MCRNYSWIILLPLLFSCWGIAASEISAVIIKSPAGSWSVSYTSDTPVASISFQRSPDSSRVKRWKTKSGDFKVFKVNDYETVRRVDGKLFTQVEFELTPTYTHLPKDYAPFSPFTDGGMLFHSGRFFACPDLCDDSLNEWHIRIRAAKGDNIIVNGVVYTGEASWVDSDSGQKVYVGKREPIQSENFVSLIDAGLPAPLKELMSQNLPKILSYFATRMGALNFRPSLYASYSQSSDGRYGNQGGTLPRQIFMHWYGEKAIEKLDQNATFWFFAHEVAHLYQGRAGNVEALADAWLHEGSAELFASISYSEIHGNHKIYLSKMEKAKENCLSSFGTETNYRKVALTNSKVHYSCGLLIFDTLNNELDERNSNVFLLWKAFNSAVAKGKPATAETFVEVIKSFVSHTSWLTLKDFVANAEFNSSQFFQQIATNKSIQPTTNASAD